MPLALDFHGKSSFASVAFEFKGCPIISLIVGNLRELPFTRFHDARLEIQPVRALMMWRSHDEFRD